jgi:hypothetical protein
MYLRKLPSLLAVLCCQHVHAATYAYAYSSPDATEFVCKFDLVVLTALLLDTPVPKDGCAVRVITDPATGDCRFDVLPCLGPGWKVTRVVDL